MFNIFINCKLNKLIIDRLKFVHAEKATLSMSTYITLYNLYVCSLCNR